MIRKIERIKIYQAFLVCRITKDPTRYELGYGAKNGSGKLQIYLMPRTIARLFIIFYLI